MKQYSNDNASRQAVISTLQALSEKNLNKGTSGNVSAATADGMLITPTGVAPDIMLPEHIVHMALDGEVAWRRLMDDPSGAAGLGIRFVEIDAKSREGLVAVEEREARIRHHTKRGAA